MVLGRDLDTHRSVYGNYDLVDEDGYVPTVGTDAYKDYMVAFAESHPDQMPDRPWNRCRK